MDEEKTRAEKAKVRLNPSSDRGNDEVDKIAKEENDIPLGTIHMIGAQTTLILRIEFGDKSE